MVLVEEEFPLTWFLTAAHYFPHKDRQIAVSLLLKIGTYDTVEGLCSCLI